jgi:hypothetical protein
LKDTDCKITPAEFHPKVYTYSIECESAPLIPINMIKPMDLKSMVVEWRYKSEVHGAVDFKNDLKEEEFEGQFSHVHLLPG